MKKFLLFPILLAFATFTANAQVGSDFPKLEGKTLENKEVNLPKDAKGKYAVIAVAYSLEAQDALESWMEPMYQSFTDNPFFPVNLYFVPLVGAAKAELAESKLKEVLDPVLFKYVVITSAEASSYISTLNMKDKSVPYFFVLSPRGDITHVTSGKYSDKKLDAMVDALSE